MNRIRYWFPILYGLGFALILVVLVVKMHTFTNELWLVALHPFKQNALNIDVAKVFWHSLVMVVAMAILGQLIERVDKKFRPVSLIASNLNFRPLLHPWMKYPFAALLLYNLPILAMLEEFIFRHGGLGPHPVQSWQDVLVSSLLFGLFHGVMSWNLRGGILQTSMGFWFSYVYLSSGDSEPLIYAGFYHFILDLIAFTPGAIQLCFFSRHLTRSENPNSAL